MESYQKEASNLLLKIHGQFETIDFNNINEKFYTELDNEGVDINLYQELYQTVSDYYSKDYEENKEECDNEFVKETIIDMKRLMEIANMIKDGKTK